MISNLFAILFLISLIGFIVGLIKPSVIRNITRKELSRKKIGLIFGGAIFVFFVLIGITSPKIDQPVQSTQKTEIISDTQSVENDEAIVVDNNDEAKVIAEDAVPQNLNQPQKEIQTTPAQTTVNTQQVATKISDSQYTYYSVVSVTDGDTLKINIDGTTETLRLIGIDTPETVDPRKPVQCFGKEASNKAKELLSGQKVRIEKDSTQGDRDKYGRLLVYVWRQDGVFYNEYMIKQGYAHEYTYDLPYKYQSDFKSAQTYARENQLGLWSSSTCNGDTTQAANSSSTDSSSSSTSSVKYYTSSHHSSMYYYPADCSAWQGLSKTYLKSFDSLEELLVAFPSRTLSPQCQ
jgi:endonuclease YncB( thermonuclease family)